MAAKERMAKGLRTLATAKRSLKITSRSGGVNNASFRSICPVRTEVSEAKNRAVVKTADRKATEVMMPRARKP
jgi:hypothetical protein